MSLQVQQKSGNVNLALLDPQKRREGERPAEIMLLRVSMYSNMVYCGLQVLPIWVLWGLSIRYMNTWTLWATSMLQLFGVDCMMSAKGLYMNEGQPGWALNFEAWSRGSQESAKLVDEEDLGADV